MYLYKCILKLQLFKNVNQTILNIIWNNIKTIVFVGFHFKLNKVNQVNITFLYNKVLNLMS